MTTRAAGDGLVTTGENVNGQSRSSEHSIDARAVRVRVALATHHEGDPVVTVGPDAESGQAIVNGNSVPAALSGSDAGRPVLNTSTAAFAAEDVDPEVGEAGADGAASEPAAELPIRERILFGGTKVREADGVTIREVIVDGWRFEVEIESERRAALRDRVRKSADAAGHGGPVEVRAIIPGRVVAIPVALDEQVEAGHHILTLEAMKMQNEIRATRDGVVSVIKVAVGSTVEVGDLLMVIG